MISHNVIYLGMFRLTNMGISTIFATNSALYIYDPEKKVARNKKMFKNTSSYLYLQLKCTAFAQAFFS